MTGFFCKSCGEFHAELPMCFGPSAPALWFTIPEADLPARGELTSDQCVIDEKYFFILGRIVLLTFGFFVWCEDFTPPFY